MIKYKLQVIIRDYIAMKVQRVNFTGNQFGDN
jgi:hypothetical protein